MLKTNVVRASGRPPKEADQKNRILLEAAKVITSVGYEQCNLQDIANAVNLSRPALYHYFSTKQEIFTAIALKSMRGMYQFVSDDIKQESHPVEKLRAFFVSHAKYFDENFWMVSATIVGYGGIARRDIGELESFEKYRRKYKKIVEDILQEAIEKGFLKRKDIPFVSRTIFQLLNISHWFRPGGDLTAIEVAERNFDLLFWGIIKSED